MDVPLPSTSRSRAAVARRAHNPKVGGSIPPFATEGPRSESAGVFSVYRGYGCPGIWEGDLGVWLPGDLGG
jgi:hypothetical protein